MKKVLVVDDERDILEVIQILLEMEGHQVYCCPDAKDVEGQIKEYQPDLLILDVMLGDLDGRDICKWAKSEPETKHIPILMISASHSALHLEEKACKADDYLAKPFDIDVLAERVSRLVA